MLCTFCQDDDKLVKNSIKYITSTNTLSPNKFFILDTGDEIVITYNVVLPFVMPRYTIVTHRKRETNTIFTVNALNYLIMQENDGKLDTTYEINWNNYKNKIILTDGSTVKITNIFLKKILEN